MSALQNAGLSTVADVMRVGSSGLSQVKGVGPSTVTAVLQAAGEMRSAIAHDVSFRFDPDQPSSTQTSLLASLAAVRAADDMSREGLPNIRATTARIAELAEAARPAAAPWWSRVFRGRKKRDAAAEAAADLIELLAAPSTLAARARIDDLTRAIDPDSRGFDELWRDYRRDAAAINSLLSTLAPDQASAEQPEAAHGYVSAEVGKAADGVTLDLSLLRASTTMRELGLRRPLPTQPRSRDPR